LPVGYCDQSLKMRILINTINFSPELTSTGKYTGEMAAWLAARGHNVRVITTPPHYPQWRIADGYSGYRYKRERSAASGAHNKPDVFRCPVWVPRVPRGLQRLLYLGSFALSSCPAVLRQVSWRPHVVLLVEPTFSGFPHTLCIAWLTGATSWLHIQDFEVEVAFGLKYFSSPRLMHWIQSLEKFVLKKFDKVSAISERMVDRLAGKGVPTTRRVLFPNWVDTSEIFPLPNPETFRRELGILPEAVVALYSGNMGMKQGLNILGETCKVLASHADIQFVFCGDGPYRETLVRMTRGISNVRFLPLQPVERLNELLNAADIHLLPQLADAADLVMPSKLTGIMASGRPVVVTSRSGTQLSAILDGRGIVTPPGDAGAFAAAVVQLAEQPGLRRGLGLQARAYAVARMSRDQILGDFEQALLSTCGQPPVAQPLPVPTASSASIEDLVGVEQSSNPID
jgi:colanic acid biosynthesis glycosyl transferase WcaI